MLFCCFVRDNIHTRYFSDPDEDSRCIYAQDQSITHATWCTPYLLLCCIPMCGDVVTSSSMSCCNHGLCTPCRTHYPGLKNGDEFVSIWQQARDAFRDGKRAHHSHAYSTEMKPPPKKQKMEPFHIATTPRH